MIFVLYLQEGSCFASKRGILKQWTIRCGINMKLMMAGCLKLYDHPWLITLYSMSIYLKSAFNSVSLWKMHAYICAKEHESEAAMLLDIFVKLCFQLLFSPWIVEFEQEACHCSSFKECCWNKYFCTGCSQGCSTNTEWERWGHSCPSSGNSGSFE